MSADVEIIVHQIENAVYLPTNALLRRATKPYAYLIEGEKLREKPITTGLANWERTQILEGLPLGQWVVLPLAEATLGQWVRVRIKGFESTFTAVY